MWAQTQLKLQSLGLTRAGSSRYKLMREFAPEESSAFFVKWKKQLFGQKHFPFCSLEKAGVQKNNSFQNPFSQKGESWGSAETHGNSCSLHKPAHTPKQLFLLL